MSEIVIKRIYNYPGTFHVQPRASRKYPWELAYAPAKGGYGAEPGVISIWPTKAEALRDFDRVKREIFADRREANAIAKRRAAERADDQ